MQNIQSTLSPEVFPDEELISLLDQNESSQVSLHSVLVFHWDY